MNLLIVQHVPFEGPAQILDWASSRGHSCQRHYAYNGGDFPSLDSFDALVLMGGPMSANDELPWLQQERRFVSDALAAGKQLLGICLGAQLIARVLDAEVRSHREREIGWFDVECVATNHWLTQHLPNSFTPLHWHGETFELPVGAVHLYRSACCNNQAFAIGRQVIGLQFHLELTEESAHRIGEECTSELAQGGDYVQSLYEITHDHQHFAAARGLLFELLDRFLGDNGEQR